MRAPPQTRYVTAGQWPVEIPPDAVVCGADEGGRVWLDCAPGDSGRNLPGVFHAEGWAKRWNGVPPEVPRHKWDGEP